MARGAQWVWAPAPARPKLPDAAEKRAIVAACKALIRDVLKPSDLPVITPTAWNYAVDIHGAYGGGRYRFMVRYRSGFEENRGQEFDSPFARIDRMGPDNFDVHWARHTGEWLRLRDGLTLAEALREVETNEVLRPL